MCGIAGIIGNVNPVDRTRVSRMNAIQQHRGPDGRGLTALDGAVLGHVRLAIIDLSERGAQPMTSADGRHVLTFNGEIYNYKEIRPELEAGGYVFRSDSDTEVLLAAWQRWGDACLERLNGMFAFCIYDTATRTAYFARDRFGQKPVYIAVQGQRLYFASEVKALLAAGVAARPDADIWGRYLTTGSYDDTARTYFAGIEQLLPGECASFSVEKGLKRWFYYRLSERFAPSHQSLDEAASAVREVMTDACRIHMRADVPIGIMLSGGLDSASMLAALEHGGALHAGVKCYSTDFGNSLTERPWIEAAASHHHLPWRIDSFTPEDFRRSLLPMMWQFEGPIGGLMSCALTTVMDAAHAEGVKVLQDGTGPDEAFGGYRNHHNLYLALLLQTHAPNAAQAVAEYARNWGVTEEAARRAAELELDRGYTSIDGTVPVRPDLLSKAVTEAALMPAAPLGSTGNALRDSLLHYLQGSKVPRNTRMLDRLSMAYSIELRLPLLDHRLVELGFNMPTDYYFLEGRSKGIIRRAFEGLMDDAVRLATKRSIQAPQAQWLRHPALVPYVEEILNSDSFASRGMIDVAKAKAAFARFRGGEGDNSFFVWQWINLEEWHRQFIDADPIVERHALRPEALDELVAL